MCLQKEKCMKRIWGHNLRFCRQEQCGRMVQKKEQSQMQNKRAIFYVQHEKIVFWKFFWSLKVKIYIFSQTQKQLLRFYSKTVQKFGNRLKTIFNFHWNSFWKQFHAGLNIIFPQEFVLFFQKIYVISWILQILLIIDIVTFFVFIFLVFKIIWPHL